MRCTKGKIPGPHDVPSDAYYLSTSTSGQKAVKCQCGCFATNTMISAANEDVKIEDLLQMSKYFDVKVRSRSNLSETQSFEDSPSMNASFFTKGPEEDLLVSFEMENSKTLKVTKTHPILVLRETKEIMLRADEIKLSDLLLNNWGGTVGIVKITREVSQSDVINFDTKAESLAGHIVLAEGVQVGDNFWQSKLEVEKGRLAYRSNPRDLSYVTELQKEKHYALGK